MFAGHRAIGEIHIWTAKLILDFWDTTTDDTISEILLHSATYPEHPVTPPGNPGTSWWFPSERWDEIASKRETTWPCDTEHREGVGRWIGDPSKWCKWVKGSRTTLQIFQYLGDSRLSDVSPYSINWNMPFFSHHHQDDSTCCQRMPVFIFTFQPYTE